MRKNAEGEWEKTWSERNIPAFAGLGPIFLFFLFFGLLIVAIFKLEPILFPNNDGIYEDDTECYFIGPIEECQ